MRRIPTTVLSAVTTVAAFGVSGCSGDLAATTPNTASTASSTVAAAPRTDPGPLPAPGAVSDVMSRLADPAVSGADKLSLVQSAVPADGDALDRFATALRNTGFNPVTVSASEIRWSENHPGNVLATIKITGPASAPREFGTGEFAFPMEFGRTGAGWQLTRETADMLLAFGNARTEAPGPPQPGTAPPP